MDHLTQDIIALLNILSLALRIVLASIRWLDYVHLDTFRIFPILANTALPRQPRSQLQWLAHKEPFFIPDIAGTIPVNLKFGTAKVC